MPAVAGHGADVDGDDPAGGEHVADLLQADVGHDRGELARAGEALDRVREVAVGVGVAREAPERGHDPVEPQSIEARQRRPARRRDLEHDDVAARRHDARHLGQAAAQVGEVASAEADGRRGEPAVGVGQPLRRRPTRSAAAAPSRARARACPRRSRCRSPRRPGRPGGRARSRGRRCRSRRRARDRPGRTAARSTARARQRWCSPAVIAVFMRSYTPAMRSNIARTCPASSTPCGVGAARRSSLRSRPRRPSGFADRKVTIASNLLAGRFANDGIGAVGFTSVRAIAAGGRREPMWVRFGPGPELPLSPIL